MILVGLTGGIACGKTTVANIFRKMGAQVLDSDAVVRQRMRPGTHEFKRIVRRFGKAVLKSGRINRDELRKRVLKDPKDLRYLERLLHPAVRREIQKRKRKLKRKKGIFIIEVPLLFETGLNRMCDQTITVAANTRCIRRYAAKRNISQTDLKGFQKKQWNLSKKIKKANIVIRNNQSYPALARQVKKAFQQLLKQNKV